MFWLIHGDYPAAKRHLLKYKETKSQLNDATLLCRWILREVEAVFSSGHFLLVNRTLASRHILGNNRGQPQQSWLELGNRLSDSRKKRLSKTQVTRMYRLVGQRCSFCSTSCSRC